MHPKLELEPHLEHDELLRRHKAAKDAGESLRWLALWTVDGGLSAAKTAEQLGLASSTVQHWVHSYNEKGAGGVVDGRKAHPGAPRLLSRVAAEQVEQLEAMLDAGQAPPEVGGGLWSGPKVARWLEQALGREPGGVSDSTGWRTLRYLGYSLQQPRPSNPASDPAGQEAWKKGALRTT